VLELVSYPNGALGRLAGQQPQMLLDGVADATVVMPAFAPGRFPDLEAFELPGMFSGNRETTAVLNAYVQSGQSKSLQQFFPVMMGASKNHTIHTRFRVSSVADLRGKKIRSTGSSVTEALKALGAVPVSLGAGELAEGLGRGTVDGIVTQPSIVYDLQLERILVNHYNLEFSGFMVTMLMSKARYDSLPAAARNIISRHSGKVRSDRFVSDVDTYDAELDKRMRADPKRRLIELTPADKAEVKEKFRLIQAAWTAKRPENAAIMKFIQDETTKLRAAK
jgi:TRAP-type transport system periplasmic protein